MDPTGALAPLLDPWTLLGRVPALLALVALFLHARRHAGSPTAAVALSGFVGGMAAGTALLPSILGALAGGAAGWALALRAAGARVPSAFVLARLAFAVVGVGRLGCFAAGCCFGTPTGLPWGVRYGPGSLAHTLHLHLGLLAGPSAGALPVHPLPLYESAFLLLAAAALPLARRFVRSDRAVAAGAVSLYLALRAALEPARAMVNTFSSTREAGPLSLFQWGALAGALGLAVLAAVLARRAPEPPVPVAAAPPAPPPLRLALAWSASVAAAALSQSVLTPFQARLAFCVLVAAALVLVVRSLRVPALPRRARAALAAGAVLLVPVGLRAADDAGTDRHWIYDVQPGAGRLVRIGDSDTAIPDLAQAHRALAPAAPEVGPAPARTSARALSFYTGGGHQRRRDTTGCGGPTRIYEHSVFLAGAALEGARKAAPDRDEAWQLRLGFFGDDWFTLLEDNTGASGQEKGLDLVLHGAGWYAWDWQWVGLGAGGYFGLGSTTARDPISIPLGRFGFAMPGAYARLGGRTASLEVGTGSPHLYLPGAFVGMRAILADHEIRLGMQSARLETPLRVMELFGDARLRVRDGSHLQLRLNVPVDGSGVYGTAAFSQEL